MFWVEGGVFLRQEHQKRIHSFWGRRDPSGVQRGKEEGWDSPKETRLKEVEDEENSMRKGGMGPREDKKAQEDMTESTEKQTIVGEGRKMLCGQKV